MVLDGLGAAATIGEGNDGGNPPGIVPLAKSNIHHHSGPYAALSASSCDSVRFLGSTARPQTHARRHAVATGQLNETMYRLVAYPLVRPNHDPWNGNEHGQGPEIWGIEMRERENPRHVSEMKNKERKWETRYPYTHKTKMIQRPMPADA